MPSKSSDLAYLMREFEAAGIGARWLDAEKAAHAYEYASQYVSPVRYGLRETSVRDIESHAVSSEAVAKAWVNERMPAAGTVQIVYGRDEVCVIDAEALRKNWLNIFVPGRDDAVVLHNISEAVLFICHEGELEFGHRTANTECLHFSDESEAADVGSGSMALRSLRSLRGGTRP
jgi:hypothetical protein